MLLTYHADVVPFEDCDDKGLYLMDPCIKFDPHVAVWDNIAGCFVGLLQKNIMSAEKHITLGGHARPVLFLDVYFSGSVEPYSFNNDFLERPIQSSITLTNWDLLTFLEEYENAYVAGAFDALSFTKKN